MTSTVHHKSNRGAHPMPNDGKRAMSTVRLKKPRATVAGRGRKRKSGRR